jgi:hypothetical protein
MKEFWDFDREIGEGRFSERREAIRLKAHLSRETYGNIPSGQVKIFPISKRGERVYVLAKPYILEPDISFLVRLDPKERGTIGKVVGFRLEGMRGREIGHGQAWYYLQDNILVLWECYLYEPFRKENPLEDESLKVVWRGFEDFLLERFPDAERIFTLSWEPIYESILWQDFLRSLGYERFSKLSFVKTRKEEKWIGW